MELLKIGQTVKKMVGIINNNFRELFNESKLKYKVLFDGTANIPSHNSGDTVEISLTDNPEAYDGVIIQRDGCGAWQYFGPLNVGTILKVVSSQADFTQYMSGLNLYECNCEILSENKIRLSDNAYSGVTTGKTARYITYFDEVPITKIIGIKLN